MSLSEPLCRPHLTSLIFASMSFSTDAAPSNLGGPAECRCCLPRMLQLGVLVRVFMAGCEASSDPRGHLYVTWGVYLCAGKPPLADIILSHPPDLT